MSHRQTPESFWAKVDIRGPDDCWLYTRKCSDGYGVVRWHGELYYAHRVAYALTFGAIPFSADRRQLCLHTCDVRNCCNPKHLYIGDNQANILDMYRKNRDNQHDKTRKVTDDQVREIRALYTRKGENNGVALAKRFGISSRTCYDIIEGKKHKRVL